MTDMNILFVIFMLISTLLLLDTRFKLDKLEENQTYILFFDNYSDANKALNINTGLTWICSDMSDNRTGCVITKMKGENK